LKGNEPFIGKTANLSDSKLGLNAYTEIALGFSREINKKLTLGVRFKYLIGIVNIYTERSNILLTTDAGNYTLTASSDFLIYSSSPFDSLQSIDKQIKKLKPSNINDNTGYAFDFGGEYRLNKRWTFGLSIIDLGSINWKSNVKEYRSKNPNKQFVFNGIDINEAFPGGKLDSTVFNNLIDSLKETVGIDEYNGTSYRAPLKTKLFTSVAFSLSPNDRFGLLMRNDFANKSVNTLISVSYNRNIGKWFAITLSNTFVSGNIFNPGAGFNLNIGFMQFYMIGDHFSSLYAADMKNFGMHFGMNILFGKTKQGYRYEKQKNTVIEEEEKSSRYKKLLPIVPLVEDSMLLKDTNIVKLIDSSKLKPIIDTSIRIPIVDSLTLPNIDTIKTIPVDTVKNVVIPPIENLPSVTDTTQTSISPVEKITEVDNKTKPKNTKKDATVKPKTSVIAPKSTVVKPKTKVVKPKK
jgi:hypothetical protein